MHHVQFEGQPGQTAYAATKGALASMTLPMARDLGRHGVRVLSIAPTLFVSAMSERMPEKAVKSLDRELVFPKRLVDVFIHIFLSSRGAD
jgi:3-hydroxyacyl-CoA dehydrogenase/3-hydroxy-2-methylbutyryl-CoA dehydrogenase